MYFESAKAHKPVSEMSHCCYEVYTTLVLFRLLVLIAICYGNFPAGDDAERIFIL